MTTNSPNGVGACDWRLMGRPLPAQAVCSIQTNIDPAEAQYIETLVRRLERRRIHGVAHGCGSFPHAVP